MFGAELATQPDSDLQRAAIRERAIATTTTVRTHRAAAAAAAEDSVYVTRKAVLPASRRPRASADAEKIWTQAGTRYVEALQDRRPSSERALIFSRFACLRACLVGVRVSLHCPETSAA